MREMRNVNLKYSEDGRLLTIEVDLTKDLGPSSTGKTSIVATTGGNVPLDGPAGRIRMALNVFKYER
jgi:hypothetical protein